MTREKAEKNRLRVIDVAGRLFRKHGFDGIGIISLMKEAGLTHGGFYGNFVSKDDLAAQATQNAFDRSLQRWADTIEGAPENPLEMLMRFYLSERHRDDIADGCTLAALAADAARHPGPIRTIFTNGIRRYLELLTPIIPGRSNETKQKRAIAALTQMVGAITLARATDDPDLSRELLDIAALAVAAAR